MSRNNTGNPIDSKAFPDFEDNVKNLDEAVNAEQDTFQDRLGKSRLTWAGIIKAGTGDPAIAVDAAARAVAAAEQVEQDAEQIAQDAAQQAVQDVVDGVDGAVQQAENAADRAESEADRAELARDAAIMNADWLYENVASGESARASGEYFWVVSASHDQVLELWRMGESSASDTGERIASSGLVESIDSRIKDISEANYAFAVVDGDGNAAIAIDREGNHNLNIHTKENQIKDTHNDHYVLAVADPNGSVAFGVTRDGKVAMGANSDIGLDKNTKSFSIGSDDTIIHVGDSYTAGSHNLKDKHYVGQLSAFSGYRHVNFGVGGDEALSMLQRIVSLSSTTGQPFKDSGAKYAIIATLANDSVFRSYDLSYYMENIRRLVETIQGEGVEPIIATEFYAGSTEHSLLRRVADEYQIGFIDCTSLDAELGDIDIGPFNQGHPGIRTNGIFWLPMYEYIKSRLPKVNRGIKIFRKREGFGVSNVSELLYKDRFDLLKRFKEISTHSRHMDPWYMYDTLSKGDYIWAVQEDEYMKIQSGQSVAMGGYSLIEVTVPVTATTADFVKVALKLTGSPSVYVRDYLNPADAIDSRRQGADGSDPEYISVYDNPRGSWRTVDIQNGEITIDKEAPRNSMRGNTLAFLIEGEHSISGVEVSYAGDERVSDTRIIPERIIGDNIVAQPLCGNISELSGWTLTGTPTTLVPIDVSSAPRDPTGGPVNGVCTVTDTDRIAQTVSLPSDGGRVRKYALTVWCRYFPKAFLDPSVYPGLDPDQVINRVTNPDDSAITADTFDCRTLKAEVWFGTTKPSNGGADFRDFAPLCWRPVTFVIEATPYGPSEVTFELSCEDGEVQIAKTLINEVI